MKKYLVLVAGIIGILTFAGCGTQKPEVKPVVTANPPAANEDTKAQERIADLEAYTQKLETDLSNSQAELDRLTKSGAAAADLERLSKANASLIDQIKRLKDADQAEKDILMKKAYRGDVVYNDLKNKMKDEIASGDIQLDVINNAITVYIKEKIFFDSGEAVIKPAGETFLHKIAPVFKQLTGKVIRIEGHTDNVPIRSELRAKYPTNWELGAARAINVVRYLQEKEGLNPSGLSAISYSEYRPIAPNDTDEGKSRNRRIQIVIVDKEVYQLSEIENK